MPYKPNKLLTYKQNIVIANLIIVLLTTKTQQSGY